MWEWVGDRTELQHIYPRSYGHNSVSFPFSWAAPQGSWGPSLSGCWFSLPHLIANSSVPQMPEFLSSLSYIIVQQPSSSCGRHKLHSFKLFTVKVIISWYSSTGCTCYLHRWISYFDSPVGSEVNTQQTYNSWYAIKSNQTKSYIFNIYV